MGCEVLISKVALPAAQKSISPCALHHIPQPEHRTPVGSVALATALDEARQSLQMPVASHPKDHIPPMCGQYGELAWRYLTLGDVGKSQSDSGDFCRQKSSGVLRSPPMQAHPYTHSRARGHASRRVCADCATQKGGPTPRIGICFNFCAPRKKMHKVPN